MSYKDVKSPTNLNIDKLGTQKASRKLITNAILFLANEERNSVILSETVSFLSAVASEQVRRAIMPASLLIHCMFTLSLRC